VTRPFGETSRFKVAVPIVQELFTLEEIQTVISTLYDSCRRNPTPEKQRLYYLFCTARRTLFDDHKHQ